MAKTYGGTRNYPSGSSAYVKRQTEYESLMSSGDYSSSLSHFYSGGGFVVTHNEHNAPGEGDDTRHIANSLAKKGYRIYLGKEKTSKISDPAKRTGKNPKVQDGKIEVRQMDIKTINRAGKNTIKNAMESATKQNASVVILGQRTRRMTRAYVESQIKLFQEKSPARAREKLEYVIVVGRRGTVHRHKLK